MRFKCESVKSRIFEARHGVSLEDAQQILDQMHIVDRKRDDPKQFRAIGRCEGRLCSVIFEIRRDIEGEDYSLITAWKSTRQEEQSYAENI